MNSEFFYWWCPKVDHYIIYPQRDAQTYCHIHTFNLIKRAYVIYESFKVYEYPSKVAMNAKR